MFSSKDNKDFIYLCYHIRDDTIFFKLQISFRFVKNTLLVRLELEITHHSWNTSTWVQCLSNWATCGGYLAKHMDRKQTLNRPVSVRNIELYCIGFCQQEISSSILGGTGNTPTYFWIVWHPLDTSWITRLHLDNFRRINNNCRIDTPTN